MGSHYIPVRSLKLDGVSIAPEIYCPANGFVDPNGEDFPEVLQDYPAALGEACTIGGYIPDPTIPIPDSIVDAFLENPNLPADVNSFNYIHYVLDRTKSQNAIFNIVAGTAIENVVMSLSGAILATNANSKASFDLLSYSESVVIIRLKYNLGVNVSITPSQPSGHPSAGLIAILAGVPSTTVNVQSQIYLKKVTFFKPLLNLTTLSFNGCKALYDIIWADTSFPNLLTAANAFNGCAFTELTTIPSTPNLTNASYFVANCLGLTDVVLPFSISTITNVVALFWNTPKLRNINSIGIGGTIEWIFTAMITANVSNLFSNCGFDGTIKLGFPNTTGIVNNVFVSSPNIRHIEFLSLLNSAIASYNVILNCEGVISITFPSSFRGTVDLMNSSISGIFNSLELIQWPMDDSPGVSYSNSASFYILSAITLAPKLKTIRGRLNYTYALPLYNGVGVVTAGFMQMTEGKFPGLEEIDYPDMPFTSVAIGYCKLSTFKAKINSSSELVFTNCNFNPASFNELLSNIVPWVATTNNSRQIRMIGNTTELPIFHALVGTVQTAVIYQDKLRYTKSACKGTPAIGMKLARTINGGFILAGSAGAPIVLRQTHVLPAQALPIGTKITFIGNFSQLAHFTTAVGVGLPPVTNLYIVASTVNATSMDYQVSLTPGGAPILLTNTLASDTNANIRYLLDVVNVTEDATYWYLTFNLSTYNTYIYGTLDAIFDPLIIDEDVVLHLNRGIQLL